MMHSITIPFCIKTFSLKNVMKLIDLADINVVLKCCKKYLYFILGFYNHAAVTYTK